MFGLGTSATAQRPAQAGRGAAVTVDVPWSLIRMSVDDVAAGTNLQLQVAFEAMFRASKAPPDAAMFGNRFSGDDYSYYFPPGAARFFSVVMTGFGARNCPAPDPASVSLLIGNPDAVATLLQPAPQA